MTVVLHSENMGSSKSKNSKRITNTVLGLKFNHIVDVWLCFAIIVLTLICIYLAYWNLVDEDSQNLKSISSKRNFDHIEKFGLLFEHGLCSPEPEPDIWLKLRDSISQLPKKINLWTAATFEGNDRFEYASLAALLQHIMFTENELFRFLLHRSRKLFHSLDDSYRSLLVKRDLIGFQHGIRDYHRILQAELISFYVRTGLRKTVRQALYKLKLQLKEEIDRLQLQRQPTCSKAIMCRINNPNGFSSGIHDYLWCLIRGFQLKRRVIFDHSMWHIIRDATNDLKDGSWTRFFQDLHDPCNTTKENVDVISHETDEKRKNIYSIPGDAASVLIKYHPDPYAWWFGQFTTYILRPSEKTSARLLETKRRINFRSPIVGVHIRRTDKITEAAYHQVNEYMTQVEEYYESIGAPRGQIVRRIYLATDEPTLFDYIRKNFYQYHIVNDPRGAQLSRNYSTRSSPEGFEHLLEDVYLLSECDHVVCTLSSGVCRIVYELIQGRRTDAWSMLTSLDLRYFFAYIRPPPRRAIYPHTRVKGLKSSDIWLRVGDWVSQQTDDSVIAEARRKKYWDGKSVGVIEDSVLMGGTYPTFKTLQSIKVNGTRLSGIF